MGKSKKIPEPDKLKESNRKLKSEVLRMRKKIRVLQSQLKKYHDLDDIDFMEEERVEVEEVVSETCPKCRSEITIITAGMFTLRKCTGCGWKGRK